MQYMMQSDACDACDISPLNSNDDEMKHDKMYLSNKR